MTHLIVLLNPSGLGKSSECVSLYEAVQRMPRKGLFFVSQREQKVEQRF